MRKTLVISLLAVLLSVTSLLAQEAPQRNITPLGDGLYRFQNNAHYSVFLVTDEGIIVTDPINAEAAAWLKQALAKRYSQPIKYVIYSHDHADHISGGEVFGDGPIVVAHDKAKQAILSKKVPTATPEVTFSDHLRIELGGQVVDLYYVGPSHSDNMVAIHFPQQEVVFAVDFISVGRLPYRNLGDAYFPGWIEAIKQVEALPFSTLVPAHGDAGNKSDVVEHRNYIQALYRATRDALSQGHSLEWAQQHIALPQYSHLQQYEQWLPLNIEGMYNALSRGQ